MSRASLLALWCAALLCFSSVAIQGESLNLSSGMPEQLWLELLPLTQTLLLNFDNYQANLLMQIESLQSSNDSLTKINSDLQISNVNLKNRNVSLAESLKRSEMRAANSEAKSQQLQTALDASTLSITQAQVSAKALEAENGLLKIGGSVVVVILAVVGVYEGGRILKVW